jgi:hypothetical protein
MSLGILSIVGTIMAVLFIRTEENIDGVLFGITQAPQNYQSALCSFYTMDPRTQRMVLFTGDFKHCPPVNSKPWTFAAQNGTTQYFIWRQFDNPKNKVLHAVDTQLRVVKTSFDLDTNDNIGSLNYIEPYLYIGWLPDHRGVQRRTRKINTVTWKTDEYPPIDSSFYPLSVKDEFIAFSLDLTLRYSPRLYTFAIATSNMTSDLPVTLDGMDWDFVHRYPNKLVDIFWCDKTQRLYAIWILYTKGVVSDSLLMLEINTEIGFARVVHNFTVFEKVPSMDLIVESSYNPNENVYVMSAEHESKNTASFFIFDIVSGRRMRSDFVSKQYPFVMTVGYFGSFW